MIILESLMTTFKESITVTKIGSSLKPNHHIQVNLVQIRDKLCSSQEVFET